MKEVWKDIKGYENQYQISNLGITKSLSRTINNMHSSLSLVKERILKPWLDGYGYCQVKLYKNNNGRIIDVHHLVWDHFGNKPRNGHELQVDHIDENKLNNKINNLQLLTNRENCTKGKMKYKSSSKYTGVCWDKINKKWMANIDINRKLKFIGRFEDEYEAHLAYQIELLKHNIKEIQREFNY